MIDFTQLALRLGTVEHFQDLSPEELVEIVRSGRIQRFSAGQVIFVEEEPSAGLFVLLEGRVQLCVLSPQGQVSILALFEPVIMFNEVPAMDGDVNPATVICLEDSLVWNMSQHDLENMLLRYPRIAIGMLRVLAGRNRRLVRQFQDLSFRSVLARSARLLLELSQDGNHSIDRRKHPNHRLAAQIATVPEAFSRSLRIFRNNGDIQTTDQFIKVLNPHHLLEIGQVGPLNS